MTTSSDAVPTPMGTSTQPVDLIPLREAAKLVDRSVSTLRKWVRAELLQSYRETPEDPSSRVLVSRQELLQHAVAAGLNPAPPRRSGPAEPPSTPTVQTVQVEESPESSPEAPSTAALELALLRGEVSRLQAELAGRDALLQAVRAHVVTIEKAATVAREDAHGRGEAERRRGDALAEELMLTREQLRATSQELAGLREWAAGSWWRRAMAMPSMPQLTGPTTGDA